MRLRTIADTDTLDDLLRRLGRLTPDTPRRWGTLTPHEALCHLGDATAMVLGDRPRVIPVPDRPRRVRSTLGLWSPLRWPHGLRTSPHRLDLGDGWGALGFATTSVERGR